MKEISQLLKISDRLKRRYKEHNRNFTIGGNLVGDIGEVLVAEKYGIDLFPKNTKIHDGKEKSSGKKVQIRASMKKSCYFSTSQEKIPDYLLSVNILEDGKLEELYNGPGKLIYDECIMTRLAKKKEDKKTSSYYVLTVSELNDIMEKIPEKDKIKKVKE